MMEAELSRFNHSWWQPSLLVYFQDYRGLHLEILLTSALSVRTIGQDSAACPY